MLKLYLNYFNIAQKWTHMPSMGEQMNSSISLNEFIARCCHWRQICNTIPYHRISTHRWVPAQDLFKILYLFASALFLVDIVKRMNEIPLVTWIKRIIYYATEEKYCEWQAPIVKLELFKKIMPTFTIFMYQHCSILTFKVTVNIITRWPKDSFALLRISLVFGGGSHLVQNPYKTLIVWLL